jgi:hypothetical protein
VQEHIKEVAANIAKGATTRLQLSSSLTMESALGFRPVSFEIVEKYEKVTPQTPDRTILFMVLGHENAKKEAKSRTYLIAANRVDHALNERTHSAIDAFWAGKYSDSAEHFGALAKLARSKNNIELERFAQAGIIGARMLSSDGSLIHISDVPKDPVQGFTSVRVMRNAEKTYLLVLPEPPKVRPPLERMFGLKDEAQDSVTMIYHPIGANSGQTLSNVLVAVPSQMFNWATGTKEGVLVSLRYKSEGCLLFSGVDKQSFKTSWRDCGE